MLQSCKYRLNAIRNLKIQIAIRIGLKKFSLSVNRKKTVNRAHSNRKFNRKKGSMANGFINA